ncbi:MAG: SRPBCC family protein [Gemmatimonadetes bacterium]|nr:SRPBCC family protein [Gemmatimonadota bacterium]
MRSAADELRRRQVVPGTLDDVFAFFESPWNLEHITPPWLRFHIVDATDERMRVGTEITYRLHWQGIPMGWRTRIAECEPNVMFADEMTRGPYRRWYHRHFFAEVPGGVEVVDVVEYELPLGPLGLLAHSFVRPQLDAIFDFRRDAVAARFAGGAQEGAHTS